MRLLIALFFAATIRAVAQGPQVPHKMQFAGMTLTIRDDARREIQKDVDALTQSPRHFSIKVERARTYFPIIEKIFADEGVPDDFKYLSLQESALIADAVSVSNAVGFWQFKDFTAVEMGLRVDKEVDERLNIASASRGAARYIKRNNMMFNNWIYALQAYQMGAGGVMQNVKETQSGATHMEITSKTYWYVKKYLAHKVAFEDAVKGKGQISLLVYENKNRKSLADLSREISANEAELVSYNKWAKRGVIPDDRTYLVVVPVTGETAVNNPALIAAAPASMHQAAKGSAVAVPAMSASGAVRINGIATILATQGDTPTKLAARAGVDLSAFLKWNDLSISEPVQPGQRFLLAKKRARATEAYHKVKAGETLWSVSQLYGVQMRKLRKYNRMNDETLTPGTTLWLSSMRPRESGKTVSAATVVQIDKQETFAWDSGAPVAAATSLPAVQTPATTINVAPDTVQTSPATHIPGPQVTVADTAAITKTTDVTPTRPDSVQILQAPPVPATVAADTVAVIIVEPPAAKKDAHVVQAKETLYAIAKQYNLAVMDLVHWNNLDLQQGIRPGQVLKLSDPQPVTVKDNSRVQPMQVVHEVKASDTLYSVARKYGVTIKELMDWNGKKDFSLSTGEKLKVFQK